jgi:hypothetical protein
MANRDIAGLLTGIPSGGIDPRTQMSGRDMLVQSALAGQQRMAGGLRGMFNGGPTIQEQLAKAIGEKQREDEAKKEVEGIGQINPQFYTPESIEAFRKHAQTTGQKDYSLLKEVDRVASTYKAAKTQDNVDAMNARSKAFQSSSGLKVKTRQMRELLDSGLQTGALAKLSKGAKSFVQSLFPDTEIEGLAEAEVFNAISNQLALLIRNPDSGMGLPGATSNRDLSFLIESVPNLGTSVEGNKLLLEVYDKMYNLQVDVMGEQRRIIKANNGVPPLDLEEQLASFVETNFKLDDEFKEKLQGDYSPYDTDNLDNILKEDGYLNDKDEDVVNKTRVGVNPRGF